MATNAVPDPYQVLGVDSSADSAAIKKAYRKLVLSCHPDKVTDQSLKEQKQEEFHKIQQAYETVGDPDKRNKYELELKAKKLRDERARAASKASTAQSRHVNINIFTAEPSDYRSSSTKHSPAKPASYKPYSGPEFSKSWEANISSRSRGAYEAERKTRRTYSDERLNEDTSRRRRDDERERERKRRQQEEEDDRRWRQAKREKEAALERDLKRAKELRKREEERAREEKAALKRDRERLERLERERETRRRREAEDKMRAKVRPQEFSSEDEEERKSRSKKSTKKDSPRDKTPSKARVRPSPREEVVPDIPVLADPLPSKLAVAAAYIQKTKSKSSSSAKTAAEPSKFSEAYPDPDKAFMPKRRSSGEKQPPAEPFDGTSSPDSPSAGPSPPRLHKSYTMGYAPAPEARPAPLNRAQTFDQDAFRAMRSSESRPERPRLPRQRTAIVDDGGDDYYSPPVHKSYSIGRDKGNQPRLFETTSPSQSQYRNQYVPGVSFAKVKTAPAYGAEHVSHSKRYDPADITFADYPTQQQQYVATNS